MGQTAFASLFQTGGARECHSNCSSKATTEFVNNGSNINGKFTAIKNMLTSREALSSQDNTQPVEPFLIGLDWLLIFLHC